MGMHFIILITCHRNTSGTLSDGSSVLFTVIVILFDFYTNDEIFVVVKHTLPFMVTLR